MTNETIHKYINLLNCEATTQDIIHKRQLSDNVDIARAISLDNPSNSISYSYDFFFIKKQSNEYIGAVLDIGNDLHAYIVPEERKKGYLATALKNVILPYMLYKQDKGNQRITISKTMKKKDFLNSKKSAIKTGFKITQENEYELILLINKQKIKWNDNNFNEVYPVFDYDIYCRIKNKLYDAYRIIRDVSNEVTIALGNDNSLIETSNIRRCMRVIDDLLYSKNPKLLEDFNIQEKKQRNI